MSIRGIPTLSNPDIVVRLTNEPAEIDRANRLVFENYVAVGFWENDERQLSANKYFHAPTRRVFVALDKDKVVGTMSIIIDSDFGLPSDGPQPDAIKLLRSRGGKLAEVSAFAMDRSHALHRKLIFFLMNYMYQFSFYYECIDRLVASCTSGHSGFYESILCFSKVGGPTYYDYTHVVGHLLCLDLLEAHSLFSEKYPADPQTGQSFYRFMLCDPHPCHEFPATLVARRPRNRDWVRQNLAKVA